DVSHTVLRSWLARLRTQGAARSTLTRRAAAARTFTAWAHREGRLQADTGALLAGPKVRRALPTVLRTDQAAALVESAGDFATSGSTATAPATAARDTLVLELLYASGLRVSELCGLDIDDIDLQRRVVRVLGKGSKERTVPFGIPAQRAIEAWL